MTKSILEPSPSSDVPPDRPWPCNMTAIGIGLIAESCDVQRVVVWFRWGVSPCILPTYWCVEWVSPWERWKRRSIRVEPCKGPVLLSLAG